jgi:hypothetical protein
MGLGRFVLMSHSEVESGGRQRLSILADAFEAVLGAIYLDQGFEPARRFIDQWLLRDSRAITADERHVNYKSHLQEYVQSTYHTHPVYRIRSEYGPDHSKHFNVDVMVGRRVLGSGKGRNKKEAEQAAARAALDEAGALPPKEDGPARVELEDRREFESTGPAGRAALEEPESDEEDSEFESQGERRSRRRGRRGGRGRRSRERTETHGPAEAEPRPVAGSGREEEPRFGPAEAAEPRLVAPRISRRRRRPDEEFEEIGRPEGPLEERHVDPYDWKAPATPLAPEAPSLEARGHREREEEEIPLEPRGPEAAESREEPTVRPAVREPFESEAGEEAIAPHDADSSAPSGSLERPQPQFGRRSSRTRRGR